jgi:HEAT repeat protein
MYKLIVRPIRTWAVSRLLTLYDTVVREHVPARVQRLGSQTWQRVLARWPALADLVGDGQPRPSATAAGTSGVRPGIEDAPADAVLLTPELWCAQLRDRAAAWEARAHAATALGQCQGPAVATALIAALEDPSAEVAAAAATALARQEDARALEALRQALENPEGHLSPITRAAALSGLADRLSGAELAPVLDAVRDQDAEVSIAAIAAVAERAPERSELHLLPVVRNEAGYFLPLVRLAATKALERTGVLGSPLAQELLGNESDSDIRFVLQRIATAG